MPLFPDDQIFGQIIHKRHPKIILGRKKIGGRKIAKFGEKKQQKMNLEDNTDSYMASVRVFYRISKTY
jgi:hypothetical protein